MSLRNLLLAVVPAMLLTISAPVPASATASLTGTLEVMAAEQDSGEDSYTESYEYRLRTGGERIRLTFSGEAPDGFVNGATVQVRGRRGPGSIAVYDGASGGQALQSAPGWSGDRNLAVVLINFTNNATKPFSRSFANGVIFSNANSVRAYFLEQSHQDSSLQGTTFDWIKVPYSNSTCQPQAWEKAARAILAGRGVNLNAFTNFMFIFPKTSACAWRGMGYLPGSTSWINGTPALRTPAHELAHNFGVQHASTLRCTSNGVRVALSSSCTKSEYGDPFTTMGAASTRHNTNLALAQMGYLPASATRTITVSGRYSLVHASASSGTRLLAIPRGNGTWFYLEYRRPYGTYFDNFSSSSSVVNGVSIRIAKGFSTITQSLLIDTVPSTTTFLDAPLRRDRSFRDYLSGAKVTVTALSSTTATVYISMPADTSAPTAPGALTAKATTSSDVTLSWTAATDNRIVAGYRVWRGGTQVAALPSSTRAFVDRGLLGGTTYAYTVRAIDGAGNLGAPAGASATTKPLDAPPGGPGNLTAAVTATTVRLTWDAAEDDLGVTGYRIWRDGFLVRTTAALSFEAVDLAPDTTSIWTVRAVDTAGQIGPAAVATVRTLPLDTIGPSSPAPSDAPSGAAAG